MPESGPIEISKAGEMKAHDGEVVTLVGVYRKQVEAVKKARPGKTAKTRFLGYVAIELEGMATDFDPAAWDGAKAEVQLGTDPRPTTEVNELADKRVKATGRLVLSPPPENEDVAQEDPEPTLFEPRVLAE